MILILPDHLTAPAVLERTEEHLVSQRSFGLFLDEARQRTRAVVRIVACRCEILRGRVGQLDRDFSLCQLASQLANELAHDASHCGGVERLKGHLCVPPVAESWAEELLVLAVDAGLFPRPGTPTAASPRPPPPSPGAPR